MEGCDNIKVKDSTGWSLRMKLTLEKQSREPEKTCFLRDAIWTAGSSFAYNPPSRHF